MNSIISWYTIRQADIHEVAVLNAFSIGKPISALAVDMGAAANELIIA